MQVKLVDMGVCLMLLELNKWIQSSFIGLHSISSLVYMVSEGYLIASFWIGIG